MERPEQGPAGQAEFGSMLMGRTGLGTELGGKCMVPHQGQARHLYFFHREWELIKELTAEEWPHFQDFLFHVTFGRLQHRSNMVWLCPKSQTHSGLALSTVWKSFCTNNLNPS